MKRQFCSNLREMSNVMGNQPVNTEVDPQALADAQALWHKFTVCATWGVISVAVILALMAIFLT
jgi:hypothetical protein